MRSRRKERASQTASDARRDLRELVSHATRTGDRGRAIELLDELVRLNPDDVRTRLRGARARFRFDGTAAFEPEVDRCIDLLDDGRPIRDSDIREALWSAHFSPHLHLLDRRLDRLARTLERAARTQSATADVAVGRARVLLAQGRREAFLGACEVLPDASDDVPAPLRVPADRLRRVARRWGTPGHPDHTAPKVFGIGLSRTGTSSLHEALGTLGLHSLHWQNDLTMDLIRPSDLPLYDGFSDTGITAFFEPLLHMFPRARFVWTTRPIDEWATSVRDHYWRNTGATGPADLLEPPIATTFRGLKGRIEAAVYGHHRDWESAHRAHAHRVETFFAANGPNRLLRLPIAEGAGWEPLCEFLDLPVPAVPFPHVNRRPVLEDRPGGGGPAAVPGPTDGGQ